MVVNEKGLLKAMKEAYKLDGYTVAVDEADLILKTVVKVYPEYEDILCLDNTVIRLVGDNVLFADDMTSRAYILCTPAKEVKQQEQLTHLSKIQWVAE